MYWTAFVLICLLQTLPTLTCVRLRTILIRRTNNCVHEVETYCIYIYIILRSWLLSTKKGKAETQSSRTQSYSGIPLLHFDNLDTSRTVERGDVYFSLYKKGRGTDTVLSQVQSLGLQIKSFNIIDFWKTLSFRKYLSPSRKRTATFSRKEGHGTDAVIAVFLQCFQSWRYTTETESNCGTTSDGKHPTKELAVRGKLHYWNCTTK